jgi:hypothetical protein
MFDAAGLDVALLCYAFLGTRSSNNDALLVFKLVGAEKSLARTRGDSGIHVTHAISSPTPADDLHAITSCSSSERAVIVVAPRTRGCKPEESEAR